MATSKILRSFTVNNVRMISIDTDSNGQKGFHLQFPTNVTFNAIYFDGARFAMLEHIQGYNSSIIEIYGTFNSKSSESTEIFLNVGNSRRGCFIIASLDIDKIAVSAY